MSRAFALVFVLALPLTACVTSDDSPTLSLDIVQDGQVSPNDPLTQSLLVSLQRPTGHVWAEPVTATFNGVDVGHVTTSEGHEGETIRDPDIPADAYFKIPMAKIERGVHIELTEGDEHFVLDVPDFKAPRTINVHTSLDDLHADQWIEIDSGVATDALNGGFVVEDNGFCFTQWGQAMTSSGLQLKLPPQGTFSGCGTNNAPGTSRIVDMRISLDWSLTPIATCDGPNLTCSPVTAPAVEIHVPATLKF
jgi:hypothetical protein